MLLRSSSQFAARMLADSMIAARIRSTVELVGASQAFQRFHAGYEPDESFPRFEVACSTFCAPQSISAATSTSPRLFIPFRMLLVKSRLLFESAIRILRFVMSRTKLTQRSWPLICDEHLLKPYEHCCRLAGALRVSLNLHLQRAWLAHVRHSFESALSA